MRMRIPAPSLWQPLLSTVSSIDDGERTGINNVGEKSPSLSLPKTHNFLFGPFEVLLEQKKGFSDLVRLCVNCWDCHGFWGAP